MPIMPIMPIQLICKNIAQYQAQYCAASPCPSIKRTVLYVQYCAEYYAHGVYMHSSTHADCPPDQVIMGTDFIHRAGMPIALEPSTQGPLKSD